MGSEDQDWAIGIVCSDEGCEQVIPLSDEEAAKLLNRDPLIRREWEKGNAMHGNQGRLIILDGERARRLLNEADEESDDSPDS